MLSQLGVHGPNAAWTTADWYRLGCSGARWLELLYPDHSRQDAELAKSLGLRVLIRSPGEGVPHFEDVQKIVTEFAGVVDVIQVGNEPAPTPAYPDWPTFLWNHARYLELVLEHCAVSARANKILLCAPGWQSPLPPPTTGSVLPGQSGQFDDFTVNRELADRLRAVYQLFDGQGVHCYDPWTLASVAQYARIAAWRDWFGNISVYVTEAGIAATNLLPAGRPRLDNDIEKAQRYRDFLGGLPAYVFAAFFFILGGTDVYKQFNGTNSYWLDNRAWQSLSANTH